MLVEDHWRHVGLIVLYMVIRGQISKSKTCMLIVFLKICATTEYGLW